MRAFGWMAVVALALANAAEAAARAPAPALPPLARRVHEDSLRFAAGVSAQKFDSLNAALIRDVADARRERDGTALGRLLVFQGAGYAMTGAALRAAPALDEAIPLAEAQRDTAWLLTALRWRAYTAGMLGRLDEQERFAQRLVSIAAADSNGRFLAIGNNFLGWIARQRGDLRQARVFLERAVEGHRALHADGDEAFARKTYGATLMDLGEYAAARRSYARQIELARRLHLDFTEAQAYSDLGVLERHVGDPGKAADYTRRAYLVLKTSGETPDAISALVNFAGAELELGHADNAADLARQGLDVCERRGFGGLRGNLLVMLASAEDALGHPEASERTWQRALALGDSVTPELRSMAIMGASRRFERAGRHAEALALVESRARDLLPRLGRDYALRFQNGWASRLSDVGRDSEAVVLVQQVLAVPGRSASPSRESAWQTLAVSDAKLGRMPQAKAAFDSACATWEQLRGRPSDPEWRTSLWASPGGLRLASVAFLLAWPPSAPESTRIAAAYERLQRFRTRTLLEQASSHGGSAAFVAIPAIPTLCQAQAQLLGDGELLVEWAFGEKGAYVFAVTRTDRRCFDLGDPDALKAKLQIARALLASPPRSGTPADAATDVALEVSRLVFGPALPMVEHAKALVLVPDGPMHLVPFAALALRSGALVTTRTLVIAPSVAVLAQARGRTAGPGHGMLVVSALGSGSPLVGARREADWLASAFEGVQRAEGALHGSEQFATTLRDFGALHFAGHTSLDDRFPWRSGIDVGAPAPPDAVPDAEPGTTREATALRDLLRAETIAATPLAARLVVLSSCETAGGQAIEGEGVSGLSTAFIAAGARAVVATLWRVDDRATETLMREFYGLLATGRSSAQALRGAQERVRRTRATSHPYYWAGFVLIGDGRTNLPLTATPLWKRALRGKAVGAREPASSRPGPVPSPEGL
jgi:tetratricopeptide (TPR) repeat protein